MVYYVTGTLICAVVMYYVLKLQQFQLRIPYVYNGDGLSTGLVIKGMVDNGWINVNEYVGAPSRLEMYDYPLGGDNLHYLMMKFISLFSSDYAVVMNLYFLLTFPLVMISSMFVFKHFKIPFIPSLMGSLLFTFIPYHIIRTGHLFLVAYYFVPLIIMIILWLSIHDDLILKKEETTRKIKLNIFNRKSLFSICVCILISAAGVYYAFFSCFFLIVIGTFTSMFKKKLLPFLVSCILVTVIAGGLILNISPSLYNKYANGGNGEVASRNALESETYGLKIIQLILPVTYHRVSWLAEKKESYNNKAQFVNENDSSSLGIIGAFGFLASLFIFLFRKNSIKNTIGQNLGLMNISAVLLGTIGGFGTIVAVLLTAQIRSYNRISLFIAFFSIFIIMIFLKKINENYVTNTLRRVSFSICVILIAVFGLYDQTRDSLVPSEIIKKEFNSDRDFVKQIESQLPAESMVFQLPYVTFPEGETLQNMGNYDLAKGYIHSSSLRWSFGGMRNREGDLWQRALIQRPVNEVLEKLSIVGFKGIYIDRNGYSQEFANKVEKEIHSILKVDPLVSSDKRLVYYSLEEYSNSILGKYSKDELALKKGEALNITKKKSAYLNGKLDWQYVDSMPDYKSVQIVAFEGLPTNQYQIKLTKPNKKPLQFNDSFSAPDNYSYRHWENPKHLVISISNKDSGWSDSFIPQKEDISKYFDLHPYLLEYTHMEQLPAGTLTLRE
ncbi:hypothetical protein DQG23_32420 [Paenibacillus contaminans]|uniref:Sugar translocase n=1 Tax=Paenibacillus contaminans TaxID=450362 RepID=A0A329M186_9BACL|nr:hypothetical protein DQG23_32420 [Paenibacillus contaminans]